jgi:hypothetical protein
MLFREAVAPYSVNHIKSINTLRWQNAGSNTKAGGTHSNHYDLKG